jgi:hypothetical protein
MPVIMAEAEHLLVRGSSNDGQNNEHDHHHHEHHSGGNLNSENDAPTTTTAGDHHNNRRTMSALRMLEHDEDLEQHVSADCGMCAIGVGILIYAGALSFIVISCVLLYEARDTRAYCGDMLLIAMLTRMCVSAASLLFSCCILWDGETALRHWVNARPLAEDEEGGVYALAFGGAGPWVSSLMALLFHGGCVVLLAIGVSEATRRGDVCLVALSEQSFTGTYTLIAFVWTWLAADGASALLCLVRVLSGLKLKPHGLFIS